jgi:hypothetical protein
MEKIILILLISVSLLSCKKNGSDNRLSHIENSILGSWTTDSIQHSVNGANWSNESEYLSTLRLTQSLDGEEKIAYTTEFKRSWENRSYYWYVDGRELNLRIEGCYIIRHISERSFFMYNKRGDYRLHFKR